MEEARSVTLYCTEGASDKEYQMSVEPYEGGWVMNFAFGRRGSALRPGTKTNSPVTWDKANAIYEKILKEKIAKGYTQAEGGARYSGTELEDRDSGYAPMLPSPISLTELHALVGDPGYAFQEKMDGENRILIIEGDEIKGVNRRGLLCSIRTDWNPADVAATGRLVLAGEDMGDHFAAFDIIEESGRSIATENLLTRQTRLQELVQDAPWIKLVKTAVGSEHKKAMLDNIESNGGEGIVAKRINAPYQAGRSLEHLKMKFQESATFEVTGINDQRSVSLGLYADDGSLENLGNVTIPANHPIPAVGDLVEVEYMMRYENGALMQPKYKGERSDLEGRPSLSQITRIKFKQAA